MEVPEPGRRAAPELRVIAQHAGTVFVGQVAVMAFGVTDTLVAGRFSSEALAALSVGSAVYISVFVALMGVIQAQLPVWAELRGAGRQAEVGRSVRQALYLAAVAMALGVLALTSPAALLRVVEVPPALQGEVRRYLAILAAALPPALLFRMYSTLNQSLGKPLLVTWLQIGSLGVKVPLSVWLVFGGLGLPPLGLAGCAWATLVVNYLMLALAVWMLRHQPMYRPYRIWQPVERPDWRAIRGFARLGIPTGLAIMVEVTSFTLMALFIARMGTVASASHQIAASLTALLYMMPLSLGIAASARVSFWLGAGEARRARQALRLGFGLALGLAALSATAVALAQQPLARLYAGPNPPVVALAAGLLLWVAAYHAADAVQAVSVFILRSYGVAVSPLVVYCLLLWGVGLGGGYLLAYRGLGPLRPWASPAAFWAAGATALALTALAFTGLLWRAVRSRPGA
ncbi:MATE family efflux transporter [Ramlibacter tataouinensis]|uniref:Candidate Na+ driven multidrug efflux n=1 Tax=Ramlibacter tataouinensis (strain ATCC BAA-407 / DSM 14655 / LMG 21543 / TTB310) TaxID=365046 RepID=F5Y144_RAMTT|nr:MATE family efflux transporter [Ramlibacter tataouinensis]AEG93445.1 Candidate Na+ driven multidrug efflux [Ramlibacter tataouinensis TTB310]